MVQLNSHWNDNEINLISLKAKRVVLGFFRLLSEAINRGTHIIARFMPVFLAFYGASMNFNYLGISTSVTRTGLLVPRMK